MGRVPVGRAVVKETDKTLFVERIEGCPHSSGNERFSKDEVVFETDDQRKVISVMAAYSLMHRQYSAVTRAKDALWQGIDVITGQTEKALKADIEDAKPKGTGNGD